MLFDYFDITVFSDALSVGTLGFVGGVLLPWLFRLIAYVVESVRTVIR